MLGLIGTMLTSILSGGATGLLGVLLQRYFDMKSKAQDLEIIKAQHAQAIALSEIEVKKSQMEWGARQSIADRESLTRMDEAAQERAAREDEALASTMNASYAADRATYLTPELLKSKSKWARGAMVFVDAMRGLTRPLLTIYLVALAHFMYVDMATLMAERGGALTALEVQQIMLQIVSTLLYLATTAVVWWFGSRPPKQTGDK